MAPYFSELHDNQVVKQNGRCYKKTKWRYCPYWVKRVSRTTKAVIGFRCRLFDQEKTDANALPECNSKYGRDYEGQI